MNRTIQAWNCNLVFYRQQHKQFLLFLISAKWTSLHHINQFLNESYTCKKQQKCNKTPNICIFSSEN